MQSRAWPTSSWGPNDTQDPKDSTLTLRPDRPSRRYSIWSWACLLSTLPGWSPSSSTPTRGAPWRASTSTTSPTTAPWTTARCGSRSTGPRCATRSGPARSTSSTGCSTTPGRRSDVGCVLLTGNGPSPKDGGWAFCSGGDQRIRGKDGYRYAEGDTAETIDPGRTGRLHILEVQRLIRFMPKVVICVVPGWAAGGGHSLHVVCDLTLASREHARFKQTDADVGQLRRRLRLRLPRPPGRPEVRPRDLLPRRGVLRRGRLPHGHGQRASCPTPTSSGSPSSGAPRSTARAPPRSGCSSSPSTSSTTASSASSSSPARPPASPT